MIETANDLTTLSAIMAGICLSAASGLRVFLPILALGLAVRFELIEVSEQFLWLASEPVLIIVGLAALFEVGAYYIPVVDNLLDVLATPAAIGGGTVIVSSLLPEMNAVLQWSTAAALGGGTAGIVQAATVVTRGLSTSTTAGLGNSLVSTGETGGSLLAIFMALIFPILFGIVVVIGLIALLVWLIRRLLRPPEALPQDQR